MGSALSRLALALKTVLETVAEYREVQKRIDQSPGIPVPGPTTPYWTIPLASISGWGTDKEGLPEYADVVVIGSGITGAAVARTLVLDGAESLSVVMLEARDVCSGATARNGGHITPNLFHDYQELKETHGQEAAQQIIRFRLAHYDELLKISTEEELLEDSQCRPVDTFDLHLEQATYDAAKANLDAYLRDLPDQQDRWSLVQNVEDLQLSPDIVVGAIATKAGAIHPYRFVTGILSRLLQSDNFELFTNTPCTSITTDSTYYLVETPKGFIRAKHIVHATNAWTSHLLPGMRGKIVPIRGHMSASRPGTGLGAVPISETASIDTLAPPSNWTGQRSFVVYGQGTYNYITQQPPASAPTASYPPTSGELMFGGGLASGDLFAEVGNADDHEPASIGVSAYLGGAPSTYFGAQWGEEGRPTNVEKLDPEVSAGRVLKVWTGILGISADKQPWVGRLPNKITRRKAPSKDGGEWIAAGYSGEGMVHAWLSGKSVAQMILGADASVPKPFLVTEKRWKAANIINAIPSESTTTSSGSRAT
ncbi:FAD-dependent protein [Mycena chlorophos]|uniref:FAD-dependent protein n=1 Tax=Mycena chlorophos TaxID=658473 RepID=A0A8H6TPF3_MYCCL|nr:FAD-dependent protein [Mycena chlorophos]